MVECNHLHDLDFVCRHLSLIFDNVMNFGKSKILFTYTIVSVFVKTFLVAAYHLPLVKLTSQRGTVTQIIILIRVLPGMNLALDHY